MRGTQATSRRHEPTRPWWVPRTDDQGTSPFLSLALFVLENQRLDAVASTLAAALLIVSRVAAFPHSIWEQDEAYFASAVADFDVTRNHPHPPWFPLWIGLGKGVHALGVEPALALQLVSVVFAVWMLFPLTALWSRFLRRDLAAGAALLFLATPAAWVLSGRAFTETAAAVPPPPQLAVAVFDAGHGRLVLGAAGRRTYSVAAPLLRRLAQDRFLDVTVARGAMLENRRPNGGPLIIVDE